MVGVAEAVTRKEPLSRQPCHRPTMPFSAWRRTQKSACEDSVQPRSPPAHPGASSLSMLPCYVVSLWLSKNIYFILFFFLAFWQKAAIYSRHWSQSVLVKSRAAILAPQVGF